jgi:outer membrane biosynthesis protein TonB
LEWEEQGFPPPPAPPPKVEEPITQPPEEAQPEEPLHESADVPRDVEIVPTVKPLSKFERVPFSIDLIPKHQRTLDTLMRMYSDCIEEMTPHASGRLEEYAMYIQKERPLDWFEWMFQGIRQVATKVRTDQRSLAYLIGLLYS